MGIGIAILILWDRERAWKWLGRNDRNENSTFSNFSIFPQLKKPMYMYNILSKTRTGRNLANLRYFWITLCVGLRVILPSVCLCCRWRTGRWNITNSMGLGVGMNWLLAWVGKGNQIWLNLRMVTEMWLKHGEWERVGLKKTSRSPLICACQYNQENHNSKLSAVGRTLRSFV